MIPSTKEQLTDTYPHLPTESAVSGVFPFIEFSGLEEKYLTEKIKEQKIPFYFSKAEYLAARNRLAGLISVLGQTDGTISSAGIRLEDMIYFGNLYADSPQDEAGIRIFLRNNIEDFAEMVFGYIAKTYFLDAWFKEENKEDGYSKSVFETEIMVIDSIVRSITLVLDKEFSQKGFDKFDYAVKILSALGNLALNRALLNELLVNKPPKGFNMPNKLDDQISYNSPRLYSRVWRSRFDVFKRYVNVEMLGITDATEERITVPPQKL